MNQAKSACEWHDKYETFLTDQMSDAMQRQFQTHVEHCSDCREGLDREAADPDSWREASELLRGPNATIVEDVANQSMSLQTEQILQSLAPTDDPNRLGRLGPYEVSGVIGHGGMGVVLKATDPSLDRVVAIKVLAPHLATCGSARQRFARESKAAAAVLHPNVIAIHGVSNDQRLPYLVMPYVRGQSLQMRIDTAGQMPLKDTLRIGAQIAAGLAAAHQQGLVHRDIKPGNILLQDGVERLVITDFGLARAVDDASMTRSGVLAGTPQYMSPEQVRGESIDSRSDLFSLGSVLYAMCAGHSPFRADTSFAILHRIATETPRSIGEINPEIPEWMQRLIAQLHQKDPDDRIQTASQVEDVLMQCIAHQEQPAVNPLPQRLVAKETQSRRVFAVAIAALSLIAIGIFSFDQWNQPAHSPLSDNATELVEMKQVAKASPEPDDAVKPMDSAASPFQWDDTFASELLQDAIELDRETTMPFPEHSQGF